MLTVERCYAFNECKTFKNLQSKSCFEIIVVLLLFLRSFFKETEPAVEKNRWGNTKRFGLVRGEEEARDGPTRVGWKGSPQLWPWPLKMAGSSLTLACIFRVVLLLVAPAQPPLTCIRCTLFHLSHPTFSFLLKEGKKIIKITGNENKPFHEYNHCWLTSEPQDRSTIFDIECFDSVEYFY